MSQAIKRNVETKSAIRPAVRLAAVPELRFPEFKGDWEHHTLGDFMTFKNGVNAEKARYGSGTKFINVMDIMASGPIVHDRIIGSVEVGEKELEKNEVRYGDILFQRSSETREEVGQSNVYLDPKEVATFGGFVIRGRATRVFDAQFFDSLLRTSNVRSDMTSRSGGSTRYNIGQNALTLVPVTVPPTIKEQEKVASFLKAVNDKIATLGKKKTALVLFKRGLLQKLFSRTLRFTSQDGKAFPVWEETRLKNVSTWASGGTPSKDNSSFWNGDIPWVSALAMHEQIVSDTPLKVSGSAIGRGTRITPAGSILLLVRGSMLFNRIPVCMAARDVAFNQDVKALVCTKGISPHFLFYWFLAHETLLMSMVSGTGIGAGKLETSELQDMKIEIPHPDEQTNTNPH